MPSSDTLQTVLTIFTIAATLGSTLAILRYRQLEGVVNIYKATVEAQKDRIDVQEDTIGDLRAEIKRLQVQVSDLQGKVLVLQQNGSGGGRKR